MSVGTADWMIAVFFLMALVLVRGFKAQIKADSTDSYDNIAGGLTILALTAVARLYSALGMFEGVPFLSETVFFDLAYWICVITGSTFIISGVANWLPLARYHRQYNRSRIEHLDLLRKVQQLVGVETRLDAVLATSLQYMTDQMSFVAGAVFKCSPVSGVLTLEATTREFPIDPQLLNQVQLDTSARRFHGLGFRHNSDCLLRGLPGELDRPGMTLPIMVGHRPVGFFLLWDNRGEEINSDDRLILRLVADVIARKIDMDRLVLQHQSGKRREAWAIRLQEAITSVTESRQRFAALSRILAERISFDNAALVSLDEVGKKMTRFSSGADGRVLVETGLPLPPGSSLTAAAVYAHQTVVYSDLDDAHQPDRAEIITAGDVKSLLAIPLPLGDRTSAVLILTSRQKAAFGPWIQRELQSLGSLLALVVLPEVVGNIKAREGARLEKLHRFSSIANSAESQPVIMETAAKMISDELNADLVRISFIDDTGSFLASRALVSTVPMTGMVPANGQMILSLMPLHEQVLNTGQVVLVDETTVETAMPGIERQQAFTEGIRSAFLVPAMVRDGAIGVISVAGLKDEPTITPGKQSRIFIQAIAGQLAASFERTTSRSQPRVGAVAMDDRLSRHQSIIDRSARRIDNAVGNNAVGNKQTVS